VEVLHLVAGGPTNAGFGQRLFINGRRS